jgi:LacI family transcriptional regulator
MAGVSAMAASAVLNSARTSSRISEETRERILKAAAKLHYRPNAAARALANRRMHTIGVAAVIDTGGINHYFMQVFNGILEAAARHEQNTTVFALHDWSRDATRLRGFCDGRIDGLILVAPLLQGEKTTLPAHTPFVSIHANFSLPNVVNVESDEEPGAWEMVRHLVAQGHRRIMHLTGPAGLTGTERRIHGYRRALSSARIPFDPELLVPASFTEDAGRDAMRSWLKKHAGQPLPHAVFCANDAAAIGCLEALAEIGLRVPDDISLAGFDDTLAARTTLPQLTTVRQPLRAMGACAVDLLLARIAQQNGDGLTLSDKAVVFPTDLVPRSSVGPCPIVERLVPVAR